MVYLNAIRTGSGDDGRTVLGDGTRVPKWHPRVIALGGIDELNSVIGVALTAPMPDRAAGWLRQVQNDLFDLCADLCLPESGETQAATPLRVLPQHVEHLERWIDETNEDLTPLKSFILPGGNPAAAYLHHARTVCRRVEILLHQVAVEENINPQIGVYLNRLSDLFFVLARLCSENETDDVLWKPGKTSDS